LPVLPFQRRFQERLENNNIETGGKRLTYIENEKPETLSSKKISMLIVLKNKFNSLKKIVN
jgi:hypothetical protein